MAHFEGDPKGKGKEVQYRPGAPLFNGEGWKGKNSEVAPGDLKPNELLDVKDMRIVGGRLITRGSIGSAIDLREHMEPAGSGPILWMHNDASDNPRNRLWASALGCFGQLTSAGSTLFHVDPMESPVVQDYARFISQNSRYTPMGVYSGKLYVGVKDSLYEVTVMPPVPGIAADVLIPQPTAKPTLRFPGFSITMLKEFGGLFFIGLTSDSAPTTGSKIVSWNTLSWTEELTGIKSPVAAEIFQNTLVVGLATDEIRVRASGDAPGTWTTHSDAGFICSQVGNAMAEVRDQLLIASGGQDIWGWSGTSFGVAANVASADNSGWGVLGIANLDGDGYYVWNEGAGATPPYRTWVGKYDPDTTDATINQWRDAYLDITAQKALFDKGSSIAVYRHQLYIGGEWNRVVATKVNDVQGTLEEIRYPLSSGVGFNVYQLIRFPQ